MPSQYETDNHRISAIRRWPRVIVLTAQKGRSSSLWPIPESLVLESKPHTQDWNSYQIIHTQSRSSQEIRFKLVEKLACLGDLFLPHMFLPHNDLSREIIRAVVYFTIFIHKGRHFLDLTSWFLTSRDFNAFNGSDLQLPFASLTPSSYVTTKPHTKRDHKNTTKSDGPFSGMASVIISGSTMPIVTATIHFGRNDV